jgi:hypothetical protein
MSSLQAIFDILNVYIAKVKCPGFRGGVKEHHIIAENIISALKIVSYLEHLDDVEILSIEKRGRYTELLEEQEEQDEA